MFDLNLKLKDMKKAIVISAIILTCLTVFESCKKSEDTTAAATQTTVAVQLKTNQSYTYTLPAVTGNQAYRISKVSLQNATTSIAVEASGNMQLVYTPALNYFGTDAVALTTAPSDSCKGNRPPHPEHQGKHHPKLRSPHKHKCGKPNKPLENNILINFTIISDETITNVN